jgi:hypothetical protein
MLASAKSSRRFVVLSALLAIVAIPAAALAITLVAWAHDPTRTAVYYQFSTDVPFDAHKSDVVLPPPAGSPPGTPPTIVSTLFKNPALPVTGDNGMHPGLTAATDYVLRVWVREVAGGPWTRIQTQAFTTDP